MDDISRKLKSIDWARLQRQAKKVQASTASALKDLVMTDLENKVRAATADTAWGASSSDLMEIAQGTFHREDYALIMSIVWQRLGSSRWRCVYKALEVLRYLLMHGSARCLEEACSAQHHIQTLEHYRCIDPDTHKDEGENVRARAAIVVSMIANPAILDEEREKDKVLRAKLSSGTGVHGPNSHAGGFSSDDYNFGRRGGSQDDSYVTSVGSAASYGGSFDYRGGYDGAGVSSRYNVDPRGSLSTRADSGGYDDAPRGKFSAIGKQISNASSNTDLNSERTRGSTQSTMLMNQSVDDLLGDSPRPAAKTATAALTGNADEDANFDPRAYSSVDATKSVGKEFNGGDVTLNMLANMDLNSVGNTRTADLPAENAIAGLPMSIRVQNLAREASSRKSPDKTIRRNSVAAGEMSSITLDDDMETKGNTSTFNGGIQDVAPVPDSMRTSNGACALNDFTPKPLNVPLKATKQSESIVAHKDADPFADLFSQAKKSGV
jgi:hypothetical protein